MKLIKLSIVAITVFMYGCEEKKEFKIKTPIEMCMESRNISRALCECIKDTSNDLAKATDEPTVQNQDRSDGNATKKESAAHSNGGEKSGWEGAGSNMIAAIKRLEEEEDARLKECLKTVEIK